MADPDVLIIGAGLAGLNCARHLDEKGVSCRVLEASDSVGGRIRTDVVGGFRLDRGFQKLFTAYPEAQQSLDYEALELRYFRTGAIVRYAGNFHEVSDPWRHPWRSLSWLSSPIHSFSDRWSLGSFRRDLAALSTADIFERPETSASKLLRDAGFSERIINRLFRPFFGAVFLDSKLHASSRMLEFAFKMLAEGQVAVPAKGMEEIPRQIAARLPDGTVWLDAKVASLGEGLVKLESGEELRARRIVVATEGPEASRLTGAFPPPGSRAATHLLFAAPEPPVEDPILVLNGNNQWPINHLSVPSQAAPEYAPPGQALVSVGVLGKPGTGDRELEFAVRRQLLRWYGRGVEDWRTLAVYRIPHAQPDQAPPAVPVRRQPVRIAPGRYVCGDHRDNASIDGALTSGRRAAEAVLEDG
jgi:phytoene dehydrogenase-like protein